MPYQYVREPLTAEEADRLSNACDTPTEKLVVWTLLDTGLRVGELCDLTSKNVLSQQRRLRFKRKGGPTARRPRSAWCRCPAAETPGPTAHWVALSRRSGLALNCRSVPFIGVPAKDVREKPSGQNDGVIPAFDLDGQDLAAFQG